MFNRIAIKISKKAEKAIKKGGIWIYQSSIIKVPQNAQSGDIAIIFDQRTNKLLAIGIYDASSNIAVRILEVHQKIQIDASWLEQKLVQALSTRTPHINSQNNAFRWVYGENDGIPALIIDIYDRSAVIKIYSEAWIDYISLFKDILLKHYKLDSIYIRYNRQILKLHKNLVDGSLIYGIDQPLVSFIENGVTIQTHLKLGHKTGFFLDHRINRIRISKLSAQKSVLDVFSYIGGFSMHALAGGAKEVTSLDISDSAQRQAKLNYDLNNFKAPYHTLSADAFKSLEEFISNKTRFDIVIIDPPSFVKKPEEIQKGIKAYKRLVKLGCQLVSSNGVLLMCSCSSKISDKAFFELVDETVIASGKKTMILEKTYHDFDHPRKHEALNYLKSVYYQFT